MTATNMTATKAVAGGIAANVVTILLWGLSTIPGWQAVPAEPKAAIIALVSAGVGAALVYFAPANKRTQQPEPEAGLALGLPALRPKAVNA